MPQDSEKPKWGKPNLIIITRGDRQERVLSACKEGGETAGPGASNVKCNIVACTSCHDISSS